MGLDRLCRYRLQYPVHTPDTFILSSSPRYSIRFIPRIHSSFPAVQGTVSCSYPEYSQPQVQYSVHIQDAFILYNSPRYSIRFKSWKPIHPFQQSQVQYLVRILNTVILSKSPRYNIGFIFRIYSSFSAVPGTVSGSYPRYIHPLLQSQVQYPLHIPDTFILFSSPRYSIRFIFWVNSSIPAIPGTVSCSYPGYIHPLLQSQVQYPVHIPDTFILFYSPRYSILFISQINLSFTTVPGTVSGSYPGYIHPLLQSQVQYPVHILGTLIFF